MSEMVERVARALARLEGLRDASPFNAKRLQSFIDDTWDGFVPAARAAILAMREPTEGMCAAGQQVNNLSEETGHFEFLSRDETAAAWQAMIDEALR